MAEASIGTAQYLIFNGGINQQSANRLSSAFVTALADDDITSIYLAFSSGGGEVGDALSLHHQFKGSPKPITIHAIGNIDSAALTVFLGAPTRIAVPGTRFMFHAIGMTFGNQRVHTPSLRSSLASLENDQRRLGDVWLRNVKIDAPEVAALFEGEQAHDCDWALSRGFIHKIADFGIPAGSRIANVL